MSAVQITKVTYIPQSPLAVIVHLMLTLASLGWWLIPWFAIRLGTRRAIHTSYDVGELAKAEMSDKAKRVKTEMLVTACVVLVLIAAALAKH